MIIHYSLPPPPPHFFSLDNISVVAALQHRWEQ